VYWLVPELLTQYAYKLQQLTILNRGGPQYGKCMQFLWQLLSWHHHTRKLGWRWKHTWLEIRAIVCLLRSLFVYKLPLCLSIFVPNVNELQAVSPGPAAAPRIRPHVGAALDSSGFQSRRCRSLARAATPLMAFWCNSLLDNLVQ